MKIILTPFTSSFPGDTVLGFLLTSVVYSRYKLVVNEPRREPDLTPNKRDETGPEVTSDG